MQLVHFDVPACAHNYCDSGRWPIVSYASQKIASVRNIQETDSLNAKDAEVCALCMQYEVPVHVLKQIKV